MGTQPPDDGDPRDLCSVEDVLAVHRTVGDSDAYRDLIAQMVTDASVAILSWSRRQFAPVDLVVSERVFDLAGLVGDELEIDDLADDPETVARRVSGGADQAVTGVVSLPRSRPAGAPITRLRLPSLNRRRRGDLVVLGRWGFPAVPPDVRRACVDVVDEWLTAAQAGVGAAPEALETGAATGRALTAKARWLLAPYIRRPFR